MLLLSYLDKFGLRVTVEAGQALACLYSEARLYKGPGLANLPQLATIYSNKSFIVVLLPENLRAHLQLSV